MIAVIEIPAPRATAALLCLALAHASVAPAVWAANAGLPGGPTDNGSFHPSAPGAPLEHERATPPAGLGRSLHLNGVPSFPLSPAPTPARADSSADPLAPPAAVGDGMIASEMSRTPLTGSESEAPPEIKPSEPARDPSATAGDAPAEMLRPSGIRPRSPDLSAWLVGQRLREVLAVFYAKHPETTAAIPEPMASSASAKTLSRPTARPRTIADQIPAASAPKPAGRLSTNVVLGAVVALTAVIYPWIEGLGVAVPQLAQKLIDWLPSALNVAAPIAMCAGSLLGGWAMGRIGAARTILATLILRGAAVGFMGIRQVSKLLGPVGLSLYFSADYALHSAFRVSLDTFVGERLPDETSRNRFNLALRAIAQTIGILAYFGAGLIRAKSGNFDPILQSYPIAFFAAALIGALGFRIGGKTASSASPADSVSHADSETPADSVGTWRESLAEIQGSPLLRGVLAARILSDVVGLAFYLTIATTFSAAAAAAVGGVRELHGAVAGTLFAGGGLLGLGLASFLTRGKSADLPRLLGVFAIAAGFALLAFWSLPLLTPIAHLTVFGVSFPLFPAQLLMILPGAAVEMLSIGTAIAQTVAAERTQAKTLSLINFASMAACSAFAALLVALDVYAPAKLFLGLGLIMTAFAAWIVRAGWRLPRELQRSGENAGSR